MNSQKKIAFNGFLIEGVVIDSMEYIQEFIDDCVSDWREFGGDLDIPIITEGYFTGHKNENNSYVGIFTTSDGKVYSVDGEDRIDSAREIAVYDYTTEVASEWHVQ